MRNEPVEIHVEILRETERAFLVTDGETEAWFPKSQVEEEVSLNVGEHATITVPYWLAMENEFI